MHKKKERPASKELQMQKYMEITVDNNRDGTTYIKI